jgi:hypothetical protein
MKWSLLIFVVSASISTVLILYLPTETVLERFIIILWLSG